MSETEDMNLEEFTDYCMKYSNLIYVREKIGDKWQSVALSELSAVQQAKWVEEWWTSHRIPVRLKTPEEMGE